MRQNKRCTLKYAYYNSILCDRDLSDKALKTTEECTRFQ